MRVWCRMWFSLCGIWWSAGVACTYEADADGDGLTDAEERERGLDPLRADSDADGLDDRQELEEHGTDPRAPDTDEDGYLDGWEVDEGSDPLDADDRIYVGGWPYNPNKAALDAPPSEAAAPGAVVPRFRLRDQHGDLVDLYDFADGRPLLLDLSGRWCGWCHALAEFVEGRESALDDVLAGEAMACLPEALAEGRVHWLTAIYSSVRSSQNATAEDVAVWAERHPSERVVLLLDSAREVHRWFDTTTYPNVLWVDSATMTLRTGPDLDYAWTLAGLCDQL